MPVWGHAWVQPASALEQALAGQDGVVHAAGLAGELFTRRTRDTLVNDGDLQVATADVATVGAAHDPRILAALDSMARLGTFFEPTLDATRHSVAYFDAERRHIPSEQEEYVRARRVRDGSHPRSGEPRRADQRGQRPRGLRAGQRPGLAVRRARAAGGLDRAVAPTAALLAATRDAARAIGGEAGPADRHHRAGHYADLVLLSKNPLADIDNLDSVEWIMKDGRIWRPGQLRSGMRRIDQTSGVLLPRCPRCARCPAAMGSSSRSAHSVHDPT